MSWQFGAGPASSRPDRESNSEAATLQARLEDDREYHQALETHTQESADQAKLKALALRVIAGDLKAYTEALVELSPLGEISTLGSTIHFTAHSPHLLEATLRVDGIQAIPAEVKSLTASDKLSVKPMPKARFHEIYQDYICGCILRVAREVFALLPVSSLLITASADAADPVTGRPTEEPVPSAAITRDSMLQVDFEHLDPSDIMDRFPHRGEFRTSRNTGTFATIIPLTPEDVPPTVARHSDKRDLLAEVRQVRADLHTEIALFEPPLVPR